MQRKKIFRSGLRGVLAVSALLSIIIAIVIFARAGFILLEPQLESISPTLFPPNPPTSISEVDTSVENTVDGEWWSMITARFPLNGGLILVETEAEQAKYFQLQEGEAEELISLPQFVENTLVFEKNAIYTQVLNNDREAIFTYSGETLYTAAAGTDIDSLFFFTPEKELYFTTSTNDEVALARLLPTGQVQEVMSTGRDLEWKLLNVRQREAFLETDAATCLRLDLISKSTTEIDCLTIPQDETGINYELTTDIRAYDTTSGEEAVFPIGELISWSAYAEQLAVLREIPDTTEDEVEDATEPLPEGESSGELILELFDFTAADAEPIQLRLEQFTADEVLELKVHAGYLYLISSEVAIVSDATPLNLEEEVVDPPQDSVEAEASEFQRVYYLDLQDVVPDADFEFMPLEVGECSEQSCQFSFF